MKKTFFIIIISSLLLLAGCRTNQLPEEPLQEESADSPAESAAAPTQESAKPAESVAAPNETGTPTEPVAPPAKSTSSPSVSTTPETKPTVISEEAAKEAALTHAGLSAEEVTFTKCKLEYDDGRQIYDVEFITSDYQEYDYEIDAQTGTVLSYDYDATHHEDKHHASSTGGNSGNIISADRAKEIALAQVPGATIDNIVEFEMDSDDGRTEYEGKIIYDGIEYEFEIDAYNETIRSWDAESIYE